MSERINPPELNPLIGENHRDTMDKISAVTAFLSRALEIQIESSDSTSCWQDDFSRDELHGLMLICRTLTEALNYEPPPKTGFG